MRHIRMAVEKSKDQALITRFEELSKSVLKNNRLSTTDLPEFLSQAIEYVLRCSETELPHQRILVVAHRDKMLHSSLAVTRNEPVETL